jgi:type VI secretion system secreted protein VgrG
MKIEVEKDQTIKIDHDRKTTIDGEDATSVGKTSKTEAGREIILKSGASSITLKSSGEIEISGVNITIKGMGTISSEATATHTIRGALVQIN